MESLDYPCVHFPVVSFVVDWKLLLLLDCDELCTTLTKMITTTEMNLMILFFFNFNLILLPPFLLLLEAWNRWIILVCIFLL